ncbi:MAG: Crp/Fnr family transcriptional regulator [Oscillospiraceae bacterium]|nr:Crp/Fnr family transcriptional regulator [Oscillospiraceae bacterium]
MEQYLFILRNSPFFQGMTEEEVLSVLHCVNATVYRKKKDEYIFRVGDSTETMGLVLRGSVLSVQEDLWGHRNIMHRIGAGEYFAESFAVTPGSVLNVSVVAEEDTEIMLLNMRRLLETCPKACAHHNRLIRNLASVMASRIMNLNEKITHMAKRSTREKLLSYLSAESMRQGKLAFSIAYDRQQLADYLCVERAAMSVELSKLQKEGYLKTNRNHFELFADKGAYI